MPYSGQIKTLCHHPYATILEPQAIGALLRTIDEYQGCFPIACALRLTPLLFVRPGELRQTKWCEVEWEKAWLRIPAERMKMRIQHIVPLSRQALEVLEELRPFFCKSGQKNILKIASIRPKAGQVNS